MMVIEAPAKDATAVGRKASTANAQDPKAGKLFAAPEGPKHSKIYSALNPEKLWFESRREKEESKGETVQISIRGGGAGMASSAIDFQFERDEEGNIIQEAEEQNGDAGEPQPEENYDPKNLPDFGEFQKEMDELRAQRAAKQKDHQDALRRAHEEKKAKEEAVRQAELKEIMAREAALKAKEPGVDPSFVLSAQQRVEQEAIENFRTFSFKT